MHEFELSGKAKADLRSIAAYTQRKWGKEQRRVYLRHLDEAFHLLAEKQTLGISCDYIKPNYRKFPVLSHVIFYRTLSENRIKIVRVLHKRMDVKSNLAEP